MFSETNSTLQDVFRSICWNTLPYYGLHPTSGKAENERPSDELNSFLSQLMSELGQMGIVVDKLAQFPNFVPDPPTDLSNQDSVLHFLLSSHFFY